LKRKTKKERKRDLSSKTIEKHICCTHECDSNGEIRIIKSCAPVYGHQEGYLFICTSIQHLFCNFSGHFTAIGFIWKTLRKGLQRLPAGVAITDE